MTDEECANWLCVMCGCMCRVVLEKRRSMRAFFKTQPRHAVLGTLYSGNDTDISLHGSSLSVH